jgi:membrane protease YdiL (CAAX protease family)
MLTSVNNYFLLFFGASCVISSLYIQQIFMVMGYYRVGIAVASTLGIVVPIYLLVRRFRGGVRRQLRIGAPRMPQVVYVILATLCSVVIVDQIYVISQQFQPVPEQYMETIEFIRPTDAVSFVLVFVGMCALVPLAEEMVFRGLVQQIFSRNMGGVVGFILAGLIFGAVHLNAHLLISICFFGVFLGFVYYATGNLTNTIISHSVFNTVALLQLTFMGVEEAELPFYLQDVRIFVVSLVILVYLLFKIKQGGPETEPPSDMSESQ